jgi:hypothetical protein
MQRARTEGRAARCCLGLLLSSALFLCAPTRFCAAQTTGQRVLLIEQGRDPFLERVGAEIEKLGFSLVHSDAKGPLEAAARAAEARAALRVLPSRTGIEVWMADATSGRSLLRQVVVDESPGGPDRELIALQTAELLRTSLLSEKLPRERRLQVDEPKPQMAPVEESQPAPSTKNTGVQLWCGALYSPGGASAALELGVSLQRFFGDRWGFGIDLGLPILSGQITDVEGSAKLGAYFVGALALVRFQSDPSRFFATVGAGAALLIVRYEGDTHEPLRASSGTQPVGAMYLRGDVGIVATSFLRFGVRALAGASFPRVSVTFAGNDAGSFGPGLFAGFAFAEISFL